jgi:hypothetical protein
VACQRMPPLAPLQKFRRIRSSQIMICLTIIEPHHPPAEGNAPASALDPECSLLGKGGGGGGEGGGLGGGEPLVKMKKSLVESPS